MNILFLCSSNIFRSQIAEAFFNKYSSKHKAESAALIQPQEKMHVFVVKAMKEKDINISDNKSKLLNPKMIGTADLIILMHPNLGNLININKNIEIWNIPDVVASETDEYMYPEFVAVRNKIEQKTRELLKKIE